MGTIQIHVGEVEMESVGDQDTNEEAREVTRPADAGGIQVRGCNGSYWWTPYCYDVP